jgi:streptogramin lyase
MLSEALMRQRSYVRLSGIAVAVVVGLAMVLGGTLSAAQAGGLYKYKTYKVPTDNSQPRYLTSGSDGNLWFTEGGQVFSPGADPETGGTFHSNIGRITPRGDVTEFPVSCDCNLDGIEQGADNALYFTSNDFGRLGRMTHDGVVDFISPRDAAGNPINYILGGSIDHHGDSLWGSNGLHGILWRYNVATGQFNEFPVPNSPGEVAVDANGIVWHTAPSAISSFNPATGATTTTAVPDDVTPGGQTSSPSHIAVAADGKIWFTDRFNHSAGYLDPSDHQVRQFPTLTPDAGPQDIAAASDGSMWFAQANVGNAARITADGSITEHGKAIGDDPDSGFENALGIAVRPGAEGDSVWFTMEAANKIAALRP